MNQIKILIVEDELIIAKNTAKKLITLGYEVERIVSSGQAAIEHISTNTPDLILMDITLKGSIDGIETAAAIKAMKDIPVIFLTAYANEDIIDRAATVGCYGYLIKPVREKELQATVKIALSKHQETTLINQSLQATLNQYSAKLDNIYINSLTSLPNRLFLRDSFDYLVSSLNLEEKAKNNVSSGNKNLVAIYNINLDRLESIRPLLSQVQQESLIKKVGERIANYASNLGKQGVTVHFADDNFIVMLPLDSKRTAQNHGQKLIELCTKAYIIEKQEIFLTASIGMACYPQDNEEIENLLEQSKRALEYVQSQGGNRCQAFTFAFDVKCSRVSNKLSIEAELHHALERNELEVYYQPIVNLKTNSITGAEALLRWNHRVMGRIEPKVFIPIAEESGLIRSIGSWVINQACQQTKYWHNKGLDFLRISINLSGVQFKQSDLFHQITETLFKTSLGAEYLELEVTETILIDNIKVNIQKLNLLKKLGIEISLDDFGTGYSSLSYLQQFPFDTLKIDSCFIRNINTSQRDAVITKSTIKMAHELGLKVVAEGVEKEEQLDLLKEFECDLIQGYLISRPLTAHDFFKLVRNRHNLIELRG